MSTTLIVLPTSCNIANTVEQPTGNNSVHISRDTPRASLKNTQPTRTSTGIASLYFVFCFSVIGQSKALNQNTIALGNYEILSPASIIVFFHRNLIEPRGGPQLYQVAEVIMEKSKHVAPLKVVQS